MKWGKKKQRKGKGKGRERREEKRGVSGALGFSLFFFHVFGVSEGVHILFF